MTYRITRKEQQLRGIISLPGSKSISNRILIIEALMGSKIKKKNLSEANDTKEMLAALSQQTQVIQAGEGGTTYRFLMSLLAVKDGIWTLEGSGSMNKRPVNELVEALRKLGTKIEYLGKEGFPPLKIIGGKIKGGKLKIDSTISSQFISSLLLVAPYMPKGLELTLAGEAISASYIDMTIQLMSHFGVDVKIIKNKLIVQKGGYKTEPIEIEPDWSAASYWYQMAALSDEADITLKGLASESLQGDAVVASMFQSMNVITTYKPSFVHLTKLTEQQLSLFDANINGLNEHRFTFDLSSTPDLFPALVVLFAAKGWEAVFKGVAHLEHKESNRLKVFQQELKKMGVTLTQQTGNYLLKGKIKPGKYIISTHNDHRVAMAFTALALVLDSIYIENPEVVNKSYPTFWDDIQKVGLQIKEV